MRTGLISIATDTLPLDGAFYLPEAEPSGAVTLFHGNTMNFYVGAPRFLPPVLTRLGFACLAFNRRGHDILSIRDSRAAEHDRHRCPRLLCLRHNPALERFRILPTLRRSRLLLSFHSVPELLVGSPRRHRWDLARHLRKWSRPALPLHGGDPVPAIGWRNVSCVPGRNSADYPRPFPRCGDRWRGAMDRAAIGVGAPSIG
jgi:hypothetical protein